MQLYSSSQADRDQFVSTFRPQEFWLDESPKALRHFKRRGSNLGSIRDAFGLRALEVANAQYDQFYFAIRGFVVPDDISNRITEMFERRAPIAEIDAVDVNGVPFAELVRPTRLVVARDKFQFINDHFAGDMRYVDTTTATYLKMIDAIGVQERGERWGRRGILVPRIWCARMLVERLESAAPNLPDDLPTFWDLRYVENIVDDYFEEHPEELEDCD
jgi:hypothetical protein